MSKGRTKSDLDRLEALETFADAVSKYLTRLHLPSVLPVPVLPLHFHCSCGYHPCVCDHEHRERQ